MRQLAFAVAVAVPECGLDPRVGDDDRRDRYRERGDGRGRSCHRDQSGFDFNIAATDTFEFESLRSFKVPGGYDAVRRITDLACLTQGLVACAKVINPEYVPDDLPPSVSRERRVDATGRGHPSRAFRRRR